MEASMAKAGSAAKTWSERVARWERSGQTAKTFASREGVSAQSLAWWKWKLGRDAKARKLGFVKLEAVPAMADASPFEIVLAHGRVLRVHAGFDASELARLVATLEERSA
jgi:transposase